MKSKYAIPLALASALTLSIPDTRATDIALFDFGINIDGTTSCNLGPCDSSFLADLSSVAGVDDSGFDFISGIGNIMVSIMGAGNHSVTLFLDHDIDAASAATFDESGAKNGALAANQGGLTWEIDEPFFFGDIFDNFLLGALDGSNSVPAGFEDDVSMALGFDFSLGAGQTAKMNFTTSTAIPAGGLFLSHTDPFAATAPDTLYFTADIQFMGPLAMTPEPGTLVLLGLGLAGIGAMRTRRGLNA